jgi:hypothetical protein
MQTWEYLLLNHGGMAVSVVKSDGTSSVLKSGMFKGGEVLLAIALGELGRDGWEAVCPTESHWMLLKRPKSEP